MEKLGVETVQNSYFKFTLDLLTVQHESEVTSLYI